MAVRISPGLLATHGRSDAGRRWLERLPFLVAEAERRFGVRAVEPFETHIAYVAAASPDSVLKVNFPDEESEHESHALELAAGDGTVRLLARDDELRALLLERLEPGKTLWTVPEAEANPIAARVLRRFWRPVEPGHPFRRLADEASRWAEQIVPEWDAGGRPFPRELAEEVYHADWHPNGNSLAVIRAGGGKSRVEYPIGKTIYETFNGISDIRFSPKGDRITISENSAGRGSIAIHSSPDASTLPPWKSW